MDKNLIVQPGKSHIASEGWPGVSNAPASAIWVSMCSETSPGAKARFHPKISVGFLAGR
jgi:hypothetical protein